MRFLVCSLALALHSPFYWSLVGKFQVGVGWEGGTSKWWAFGVLSQEEHHVHVYDFFSPRNLLGSFLCLLTRFYTFLFLPARSSDCKPVTTPRPLWDVSGAVPLLPLKAVHPAPGQRFPSRLQPGALRDAARGHLSAPPCSALSPGQNRGQSRHRGHPLHPRHRCCG